MKVINKLKVFCLALLVLVFSAIPTMALEPKAVPQGTLTYHTGKENVAGMEFKIYRIMDATVTQSNPQQVAYSINQNFKGFLTETLVGAPSEKDTLDLKAQEYIKNNVSTSKFKDDLKTYITNNTIAPVDTITGVSGMDKYTKTLDYGYYVILSSNETHQPSFFTMHTTAQDVYLKGIKPGVDKTIDTDKKYDSAQIGETVSFTVKSTVPNMTGLDKYTFKLVDKFSKGLTFVPGSVKVQIGTQPLTLDAMNNGFTVTGPNVEVDGTKLIVEIKDFINYKDLAFQDITFTYQAIVNKDAIIDGVGNKNNALIQYGNDPQQLESSQPSEVEVYTHKLTINKIDDNNPQPNQLAGAEFELFKQTNSMPETYGDKLQFIDLGNGKYRVATLDEINTPGTAKLVSKVVSPTSGKIEIDGLDAATYKIVEIKAPDGYNKLKQPIIHTIAADKGSGNLVVTGNSLDVVNKKGVLLPETGGIGTMAFTVIGVVGILAVAYSFKPKKSK